MSTLSLPLQLFSILSDFSLPKDNHTDANLSLFLCKLSHEITGELDGGVANLQKAQDTHAGIFCVKKSFQNQAVSCTFLSTTPLLLSRQPPLNIHFFPRKLRVSWAEG